MASIWTRLRIPSPASARLLHSGAASKPVPAPRGDITDHTVFLTKIGRGSEAAADKFKSWEHLFTATREEMKADMGLTVKQRKWIKGWTEKYRQGVDPYNIPAKPPKKKTK
ncbi:hypothetical protein BGZ73_006164 [Actinomortierella ambigua]|nr:hypothetical protein BGZ73_006164 [Actinomortierella ambigua]